MGHIYGNDCDCIVLHLIDMHYILFQVTKMLPGGMWVLGVFITGPEDILDTSNNVQKLKSVLSAIYKTLSWNNKHLCGNNQDEKLILAFNNVTQKYAVWDILLD